MRKIINIFLASSITEFHVERMEIENFIRNVSDKFETHYDIKIQPWLCENFDDAVARTRKQDEFNEKIRESELCFFLFFTDVGKYTEEEFNTARKSFLQSGKPKIYTYFKQANGETVKESIKDFMKMLDESIGHFYGNFDHLDTVKLRILLSLKLEEMDFLEVKVEDGSCVVDGQKVLSLKNVSEFANNQLLKDFSAELAEVEKEYYDQKKKYIPGESDEETSRRYREIATKRQNLLNNIEELQKSIFKISLRMCKDEIRGEITQRQKEAYRLFEAGDLEAANRILDFGEIKSEYERRTAIRAAEQKIIATEQKEDARVFIGVTKTKIEILEAMVGIENRFEEIENFYDEIVPEAFEYEVELDTVYAYICFLTDQNKQKKAIKFAEKLERIYERSSEVEQYQQGRLFNVLGVLCSDTNSPKKAEAYYLKAIKIIVKLAKENFDRFSLDLATSYNNAGSFYFVQGQPKKAEEYYLKAIKIREQLAEENPDRFNPDLAQSYNGAGVFYEDQGQPEKAEGYYLKAIEIFEQSAEENPDRINPDLAQSYNNAGNFYFDQGQPEKVEEYYLKAIKIREQLVKENPDRFNPNLAMSYNDAGALYSDQGQLEKAEGYYLKAIEIFEQFAEENPDKFNPGLAYSYNNAGVFYDNHGQPEKAEEYYLKAIKIYEQLVKENPDRFNPYLADSYNNTGVFYKDQGQPKKAEKYYLEAIKKRKQLAEENPDRFNPDLAANYFNYAIFTEDDELFAKALEKAQTQPSNPYCRRIIEALTNNDELYGISFLKHKITTALNRIAHKIRRT